jgi:hypothetical protein
LDC